MAYEYIVRNISKPTKRLTMGNRLIEKELDIINKKIYNNIINTSNKKRIALKKKTKGLFAKKRMLLACLDPINKNYIKI